MHLNALTEWNHDTIHDCLIELAQKLEVKNGTLMWPIRIAVSGMTVTPGGAVEILDILGKEESMSRLQKGLAKLSLRVESGAVDKKEIFNYEYRTAQK